LSEDLHFENGCAVKASILKINHQKLSCIGEVKGILSRKTRVDHQMEFTNEIFLKFGIKTKNFIFHLLQKSLK
jgi:hypothetical protein